MFRCSTASSPLSPRYSHRSHGHLSFVILNILHSTILILSPTTTRYLIKGEEKFTLLSFTMTEARDTKVAPMVSDPPSYSDATGTSSSTAYGDGNVFTDLPRPTMAYSAARREPYQPRRKGWSFGFFDCFRDPGASTFTLTPHHSCSCQLPL